MIGCRCCLPAHCVSPSAHLQEENGDELHHALGAVQGHEGEASLRVRFKLDAAAQAGNERGQQRCVGGRAC